MISQWRIQKEIPSPTPEVGKTKLTIRYFKSNLKPDEQLKTIFLNVTSSWLSGSFTIVEYCINRGQSYGIHISSGFALNYKSGKFHLWTQ